MEHDVFISYSSKNKKVADAMCHVLEEHGVKCWIAPRDIPGGADYGDVINDAIKNCRIFIIIFSKPASLSNFVSAELNVAFSEGKYIIPYRIDETPLKGSMRLYLNRTHWIDAVPDAEARFKELVEVVFKFLGKQPPEWEGFPPPRHRRYRISFPQKPVIIGLCIVVVIALAVLIRTFKPTPSPVSIDTLAISSQTAIDSIGKDAIVLNKEKADTMAFTEKDNSKKNLTPTGSKTTPVQSKESTAKKKTPTSQKAAKTTPTNTDARTAVAAEKSPEKKNNNSAQTAISTDSLVMKWQQAAEQGNADAQYRLGKCYYNGKGMRQDYTEAVKWFRKAAEQGHADAQNYMGACYETGKGVTKDYEKAVKWYLKAAEQGNADALYNLGNCYCFGQGVTQDYQEAAKWWSKAAEQGNAEAQYNLGVFFSEQGNYTESAKWYRQAAEQGNADAQYQLGKCYYNGKGMRQDYTEAVKWYSKAAEQGHADAQNYMGACYETGKGVTKDYEEAIKWYRKAAEQGNAGALYNLGNCYCFGRGVTQDYQEAAKWWSKAAEQGNAEAQYNLGASYSNQGNYAEAVKWYRKAAKQGDEKAQKRLRELGESW